MRHLSPFLQPIYRLEISLENEVLRVDEPAGTKCPLAVVFKKPLHLEEISTKLSIPQEVEQWENVDPHYPKERGFRCKRTSHALSGPIN